MHVDSVDIFRTIIVVGVDLRTLLIAYRSIAEWIYMYCNILNCRGVYVIYCKASCYHCARTDPLSTFTCICEFCNMCKNESCNTVHKRMLLVWICSLLLLLVKKKNVSYPHLYVCCLCLRMDVCVCICRM